LVDVEDTSVVTVPRLTTALTKPEARVVARFGKVGVDVAVIVSVFSARHTHALVGQARKGQVVARPIETGVHRGVARSRRLFVCWRLGRRIGGNGSACTGANTVGSKAIVTLDLSGESRAEVGVVRCGDNAVGFVFVGLHFVVNLVSSNVVILPASGGFDINHLHVATFLVEAGGH